MGFHACLVFLLCASLALAAAVPAPTTPRLPVPIDEQLHWAELAPFFPRAVYKPPPSGCEVDQVNVLQRHGARFPTSGAGALIRAAVAKLQNATSFSDARLEFVRTFEYNLGTNDLVQFGADQSFDAGQEAFLRYAHLFSENNIPFVRSDSSARVVASANNWTAGFAAASRGVFTPKLSVILSSSGNDTLEDGSCPAAGNSLAENTAWEAVYAAPIATKLNAAAPGANLVASDITSLLTLCPFETVFELEKSPWCTLFEQFPTAFPGLEYDGDLDKFYGTGYGQPLGPVQGVGWVNELLARLTDSAVHDATQTNHTLDASPASFPLNHTLYADFSHDDEIAAIVSAIGLFRPVRPLDPTRPDPRRTWRASAIVPFSGRVVVERLSCPGASGDGNGSGSGSGGDVQKKTGRTRTRKVRVLVQDEVQPLEFCAADGDGVCTLDRFVASQVFARTNGDGEFEKCFEGSTSTRR